MFMNGPRAMSRNERLQTCYELAERLQKVYGDAILAIGVYGSVARGTDGPFSDIEMLCVLRSASSEPVEFSYEWSAGPWKAEVDICSAGLALKHATAVKGRWPLTHGSYKSILSLFDPEGFLPGLGQAVEAASAEDFRLAVNEVLVGEMYEFVGKLRNINLNGPHSYLPYLAMQFAHYGAMLIGLHNRKTYSTGPMVLPEALELPDRPAGFDAVARMVMSGELKDPAGIISACEAFWQGIAAWADEQGYVMDSAVLPF